MSPSTNPHINNAILEKIAEKIVNLLGEESRELENLFSFTATPKVLDNLANLLNKTQYTQKIEGLKTKTGFYQALELREFMEEVFKEWDKNPEISEKELAIAKWVIHQWGKVREGDKEKLQENLKASKEGLTFPSSGFASWTKYLAFKNPKEYAIYDARVNYSINWLLYKAYEEVGMTQEDRHYFQFLLGANQALKLLDYEIFILLPRHEKIEEFLDKDGKFSINIRKGTFYKPSESYKNYISLLNRLKEKIYPDDKWGLTKIEMILFAAAPTKIAQEVLNFFNSKK